MKLSDYVAEFIEKTGTEYVFTLTGGAVTHLIDSVDKNQKLNYICNLHEQATAMAADAYARVTGKLGVAMVTSGPGATNLLTGCCSSYYESVPIMFITGQVSVTRMKGTMGIRQLGFQETDVCKIFEPITKYVVTISEPSMIQYEMEKAYCYALEGRKGPVLLDIPDDIQRAEVFKEKMSHFLPNEAEKKGISEKILQDCIQLIKKSKYPLLLAGWGVRSSGAEKELDKLVKALKIPAIFTWAGLDLLSYDNPFNLGSFGMNGLSCGKSALDETDLIISIGARLNTKHVGGSLNQFAPQAKKIIVDIDEMELEKFSKLGLFADLLICQDAGEFINSIIDNSDSLSDDNLERKHWLDKTKHFKENKLPTENLITEKVNPYTFFEKLSVVLPEEAIIIGDTGCTIVWLMQSIQLKQNQRCFSSFNHTPMGYALPASVGASFATYGKIVICITGDGGFQMNIQELATIMQYKLNIKIIVFDNKGYSMIRSAQKRYLNERYVATQAESGVACPDYTEIAKAYGYEVINIRNNSEINHKLELLIQNEEPTFCLVEISPTADVCL